MSKRFRDSLSKLLYCQKQVQAYYQDIAAVVSAMHFVRDDAQEITLHAMPSGTCFYRDEFIELVPFNQLASVEAHIAFHTALQEAEMAKLCGVEPWKFRFAIESHIHAILEHSGMVEIFGTGQFRHKEWDRLGADAVARKIADPPPGVDPVAAAIKACPARLPLHIGKKERRIDQVTGLPITLPSVMTAALMQSQAAAKDVGSGSLGAKIEIGKVFEPQVKWEHQLRDAENEVLGTKGRSYKRPHRRSAGLSVAMGRRIILPRPNRGLDYVIMPIDLSGSVVGDPGLLEAFLAEQHRILTLAKRDCRVIMHDDDILEDFMTKDVREIKERLRGAGGTDFRPVYELLEQSKEPIPLVVWLTDLCGQHGRRPKYPILWCTGMVHDAVPWGRHVKIKPKIAPPPDAGSVDIL